MYWSPMVEPPLPASKTFVQEVNEEDFDYQTWWPDELHEEEGSN